MNRATPDEINNAVACYLIKKGYTDAAEIFKLYKHRCAGELLFKLMSDRVSSNVILEWYRCMMENKFTERKMVIWKLYTTFLNRIWENIENAFESEDLTVLESIYTVECRKAIESLINRESISGDQDKESYDVDKTIIDIWCALIKMEEVGC